ILVALSRSSSGYFLGAAMLLILPWIQSLHQTRGDSSQPTASSRCTTKATIGPAPCWSTAAPFASLAAHVQYGGSRYCVRPMLVGLFSCLATSTTADSIGRSHWRPK